MIVYGRKNGKTLRSTLNSVTEVRNGYIYAAATGERIAKIGNVIMMSLQEALLIIRASFGNKKAKKELRQREIRDRQKNGSYEAEGGSSCYVRTRTRTITGSVYMDCQRPGKSVEKLSKL